MNIEEELKKIFNELNARLDSYFSPSGKIIFLSIICLAVVALLYFGITFTQKSTPKDELPANENIQTTIDDMVMPEEKMKEVEIDDEIDDIDKSAEKMVSLSVEEYGRSNPFLPSSESYANTRKYGFELMAPPESLADTNSEAAKVMATKVSGIMFEPNSPSAILNIEGMDYLVRSGDYINNYKVLAISKDLVTVQLGANVYKARVGEVLPDAEINYNNVYNLEQKFGGAKR